MSSSHRDRDSYRERDRDRDSDRSSKRPRYDADPSSSRRASDQDAVRLQAKNSSYGSIENPYAQLESGSNFVWAKKRDKEKKMGLTLDQARERDAGRRREAQDELQKLNRKREERERESQAREAETTRIAAQSESQMMAEWIAKEDDFFLEQAKKRAEIRVRERRAKPIDYLALNLKWSVPGGQIKNENDEGEGLDVDLEEPYAIFENITLEETEELENDIKMYLSLEKAQGSIEFWRSMLLVCASALEERRMQRRLGSAFAPQLRQQEAMKAEFTRILAGKTQEQLSGLQDSVQRKLSSGEPIDVEYWENLLKELIVSKTKTKLKAMHEIVLQNRLEQLRRQQRDEARIMQQELSNAANKEKENDQASETIEEASEEPAEPWDASMEPPNHRSVHNDDRDLQLVEPQQDRADLVAARRKIHAQRFVSRKQKSGADDAAVFSAARRKDMAEAMFQAQAEEDLDEDEELFEMEEELTKQAYVWEDKYRPRKPRFFNKVQVGFEWNKYNQTHYDADNPPPKVVTGYRMVLFYPDLIDKTKAPSFEIVKNTANEEVCTLIFKAGPPYEDIAFQIVNQEWEFSHKRGFRCSFDRGILSLAFTFKKLHYRK